MQRVARNVFLTLDTVFKIISGFLVGWLISEGTMSMINKLTAAHWPAWAFWLAVVVMVVAPIRWLIWVVLPAKRR